MSTAPLKQIVTVLNPEGLHLRPADLLVRTANQFSSSIMIGKNAEMVDCKSILSLITLGADQGTELKIEAEGADAAEALQCIAALFESGFSVGDDRADENANQATSESTPNQGNGSTQTNGSPHSNGSTQGQTF